MDQLLLLYLGCSGLAATAAAILFVQLFQKGDVKNLIVLAFIFLITIIVSAKDILNFNCKWLEGCSWSRAGVDVRKELEGVAKAYTDASMTQMKKDLEIKFSTLNAAILDVKKNGTSANLVLPSAAIKTASSPEKATVLLFFKDGRMELANIILKKLKNEGYISSITNSSLDEVRKLAENTSDRFIQVADAGDNVQLKDALKGLIMSMKNDDGSHIIRNERTELSVTSGWTFKNSAAQIYLF